VIKNNKDENIIRTLVKASLFSDDESSKVDRVLDVAYQLLEIPSGPHELYEPIWGEVDDCCIRIKNHHNAAIEFDGIGFSTGLNQDACDGIALSKIVDFLQTISIIFNKSDEREKIKQMFQLHFSNIKPLFETTSSGQKEKVELKMVEAEA